jgi:hypothetical protein
MKGPIAAIIDMRWPSRRTGGSRAERGMAIGMDLVFPAGAEAGTAAALFAKTGDIGNRTAKHRIKSYPANQPAPRCRL